MTGWLALGGTLLKGAIKLFQGRQKRQEAAQEIKARWEIAQTEKFPWFVSAFAAFHIIGPVDYAFYIALSSAWPIESPEEMAHVVRTTLDAFPMWWTGAFVTILLAMMGIRANGQEKVNQSRAREKEREAEAKAEREKRNRIREEKGETPLPEIDRPGPPGGGP